MNYRYVSFDGVHVLRYSFSIRYAILVELCFIFPRAGVRGDSWSILIEISHDFQSGRELKGSARGFLRKKEKVVNVVFCYFIS